MNRLSTSNIFYVIVAGMLLTSCSNSSEVSFQSGGITHTFAEGNDATKQGFLLPIYPGAKPSGGVSSGNNAESSSFLLLSSPDSAAKISDYYQQQLKKEGWEITQQDKMADGEVTNIGARKGELEASVMVSGEEKSTSISLTVSRAPEGTPAVTDQQYTPDKLNPPTD